jgi:hypothetical protein
VDAAHETVVRRRVDVGEAFVAAYRTLLALSAMIGGAQALAGVSDGDLARTLVIAPALLVAAGIGALALRAEWMTQLAAIAGYVAMLVWLALVPQVTDEAVLVPLGMAALCALAARHLSGGDEESRETTDVASTAADAAWIEEDGRVVP